MRKTHLNLAYRWSCRLGSRGPRTGLFDVSKNRYGRVSAQISEACGCSNVPCASSSSGPLCGSQEEPPPVRPPRRLRVGPAQRASPLEPPPRLCEPPELQPRQLPRPLALRLGVLSPRV